MRIEVNAEPSSIYMVAMNMHSTHAQKVVIGKPGVQSHRASLQWQSVLLRAQSPLSNYEEPAKIHFKTKFMYPPLEHNNWALNLPYKNINSLHDSLCWSTAVIQSVERKPYIHRHFSKISQRQIYAKETVSKPSIDPSYLTNLHIALRLRFAIMQKDITWLYCMSQQRKKEYQSLPARAGSHCQRVGQQ